MQTTLQQYLDARGETLSAYAARMGLDPRSVARLAGISYSGAAGIRLESRVLSMIAEDTGIPVGVLAEDAVVAARRPRKPRAYNRKKGIEDGEEQARQRGL